MSTVQHITTENFKETVEQSGVVVLDWWAPWCAPCRAFGPVFERVAARHPGVVFGKVNTEEQPALAMEFRVQSIPTVMVIRDKTLLFAQPGMLPEKVLEDLVKQAQELDMDEVKKKVKSAKPHASAKAGAAADAGN